MWRRIRRKILSCFQLDESKDIKGYFLTFLKPQGLMFGPETSTANRAMIGGMIGNNSCGLHSIVWGTTRDNLLEVKAILSDGSEAVFKDLAKEDVQKKCQEGGVEGKMYQKINSFKKNAKTTRSKSLYFL